MAAKIKAKFQVHCSLVVVKPSVQKIHQYLMNLARILCLLGKETDPNLPQQLLKLTMKIREKVHCSQKKAANHLWHQKENCPLGTILERLFNTIAESFYYVNYGSSIIMSKVSQIISVMKTKTWVFLLSSRQHVN